jgi:hypothetical protein
MRFLYGVTERKIKHLNEDKKDSESLLKSYVMFHINVFIKMFCCGRNIHLKKDSSWEVLSIENTLGFSVSSQSP